MSITQRTGWIRKSHWMAFCAALALGFVWGARAQEIRKIGEIQGAIEDGAKDAAKRAGPLEGKVVRARGIIYQKLLGRTRDGEPLHGILMQNGRADADRDPRTSDGIFIFSGKFTTLRAGKDGDPPYTPKVGDEVIVSGQAREFHGLTQLNQARLIEVVRSGVKLDEELETTKVDPPAGQAEADVYWERLEGMRVRIPAGTALQSATQWDYRMNDRIAWLAVGGGLPAKHDNPYARRVFRDAHPLDNVPGKLFDDGNAYRFLIGSAGTRGAAGDMEALLPEGATFGKLKNAVAGGVYYTYDRYIVCPAGGVAWDGALDPAKNNPPRAVDRTKEFSVASFNVENLYDFRDDPFDQNDFAGNAGEGGVKPPFNYVPASDVEYQARLKALARQIIEDLHAPDVILAQEIEDQDIAKVEKGKLVVTNADDADGRPDTLQELALAVKAAGGPEYQVANDRAGADSRGIVQACMWRADRVELTRAKEGDALLGAGVKLDFNAAGVATNAETRNPKALNALLPANVPPGERDDEGNNTLTRAAQAAKFLIYREKVGEGEPTAIHALNNHFSSRPNARVGQRIAQAKLNAAIYKALAEAEPGALYLMAGDLNVYPRPDDPFPAKPSDQLGALYEVGLHNLFDEVLKEAPASAYSYVYEGQAQTLDQMFVNGNLLKHYAQMRNVHVNADWPHGEGAMAAAGGAARGASDHDPLVTIFRFE